MPMSTFNSAYPVPQPSLADETGIIDVPKQIQLWKSVMPRDERLNQLTHGLGFVLSLIASATLLAAVPSVDGPRALGAIVYALALTGLYLSSTLSHSFLDRGRRTFWRVADQVAILGMVVGSFVPFALVHVSTPFGWTLLATTAIAAATLAVIRVIRWEKGVPILAMVVVGLLPALATYDMIQVGGLYGSALIGAGAIFYTVGLWFLMNDNKRVHYHAVWHIATILGSACHFVFVYLWCIVDAA